MRFARRLVCWLAVSALLACSGSGASKDLGGGALDGVLEAAVEGDVGGLLPPADSSAEVGLDGAALADGRESEELPLDLLAELLADLPADLPHETVPVDLWELFSEIGADGNADGGGGSDAQGGEVVTGPFATVSGECGEIDSAELGSPSPFLFTNHLDFGDDPYDDSDFDLLTTGGQKILLDGNAGGSSIYSELFSYEVLHWCEGAELLKTEMEILYTDPGGKITDLLVSIDGFKVGVSVTRAVSWPKDSPYSPTQAEDLLKKKLQGIAASTANVAPDDAWAKQVLHVLAWSDGHASVVGEVWQGLDPGLRGDTVLVVTVTDGEDAFLY